MMRFILALPLCLAACSTVDTYRTKIEDVRRWASEAEAKAETADLVSMGQRAEFTYDKPAVSGDRSQGCALLMVQQYREADACEGELTEYGDGCKIPGACPSCEAMVQTVAQYKAERCVI